MSRRRVLVALAVIIVLLMLAWRTQPMSHLILSMMPADSRPMAVTYPEETIGPDGFDLLAAELAPAAAALDVTFDHIERFREAGLDTYRGPGTCLRCHEHLTYEDAHGHARTENLMRNLTRSSHYRFYTKERDNVYGFNGELADDFAMGKINRPCPKPGSFAMTAWAERVVTQSGDTLSEGCGQCHIGGQPQAPLGEMMPFYGTLPVERAAIDCLVCHAAVYDMDRKQVRDTGDGRLHWGQDRSMRAALSVTAPTAQACLRCHQHNFGGDVYVDEADPSYSPAVLAQGADRPRVLHPGSKRGTPFTPSWDVHAAAGMSCLECHATEGHRIARGLHTTTIMANDLPGRDVSCLQCHELPLHQDERYDEHFEKIACTTCHIPSLHEDNVTRRDFAETEFEDDPGIYIYHDTVKLNAPGEGIAYRWWSGDATFLGNPIGENPNGEGLYRFYDAEHRWPEFAAFDYEAWYEDVMRPIARIKPSKLYAMKRFNGRQHIDLQNIGPFGGMFVPYNLPSYYRDGDADASARAEMDKSMMGMMYGWMFKIYMLDKFMGFMDIDGWNTGSFEDVRAGRKVEARWIPTDAMLEISHGVRLAGALECADCHGPEGVLDWTALGYAEAPEVEMP